MKTNKYSFDFLKFFVHGSLQISAMAHRYRTYEQCVKEAKASRDNDLSNIIDAFLDG